jgi:hypothetical protein
MGFRNPVTSAVAVDTGRGGAGVRLYEREVSPGVFQGVAEWSDGIGVARTTLTGGGAGDSGGTVYAITGASVLGATAPELDLNIEGLPAGGYGPVARLKGAGLIIDSPGTRMPGGGVAGLVPLLGVAGGTLATTDANGQVTVTHGLGVNPASVLLTPANSGAIPNLVDFVLVSTTTTTLTVRAMRRDNNTAFAGNPVGFQWLAVLPAS